MALECHKLKAEEVIPVECCDTCHDQGIEYEVRLDHRGIWFNVCHSVKWYLDGDYLEDSFKYQHYDSSVDETST